MRQRVWSRILSPGTTPCPHQSSSLRPGLLSQLIQPTLPPITATLSATYKIDDEPNSINNIVFSPDSSYFASLLDDNTIKIWEASSGHNSNTLRAPEKLEYYTRVRCIAYSQDGLHLFSCTADGILRQWSTHSSDVVSTQILPFRVYAWSVAFATDLSVLASRYQNGVIDIWDVESCTLLRTLEEHKDIIWSLVFSPNRYTLASSSSDRTIRLWHYGSGRNLVTIPITSPVHNLTFSPDGSRVAGYSGNYVAKDYRILIWDVTSGKLIRILNGHSRFVQDLAFTSNSVWMASASDNKALQIWDTMTGRTVTSLKAEHPIAGLAFSADGNLLVSSHNAHPPYFRVWKLSYV